MSTEITGQKLTVTVGEKMTLHPKFIDGYAVLTSVEWTIPGTIVKNYTDGATKAEKKEIEASDKKLLYISFYWVDGGDGRVVEAKCKYWSWKDGVTNKTVTATFDVKAPKLDNFNATTSTVGLDPPASPTSIRFGKASVINPGIKWDWKVTVPSTVDGHIKDVQTLQTITKQTTGAGIKQVFTISGTKVPPTHVQLDTTNPYSYPGDFHATKGFPQKVSAGNSYVDNYTLDSPGSPLVGLRQYRNDRFKYYIMYKPDKPDAIWIPIAKAEWYWTGEAVEIPMPVLSGSPPTITISKKWILTSGAGGITSAGASTTEFPEYQSSVVNNQWENE